MKTIKKYKSYDEIEKKYTFDLESILNNKTLEELENDYFLLYEKMIQIKDSKYEDFNLYLEHLEISRKMLIIHNKIENYLSNKLNINIVDFDINTKISNFEEKSNLYEKRFGSEVNRIDKHKDTIKKWLNKVELAEVKKDLEATLEALDHKLDDQVETYLNDTSIGNPSPEEIFSILTDSEVDFGYATSSKNKKFKITEGTRPLLLKNKDEKIRKSAYINYLIAFNKHKQSLAKLLYQHIKELSVQSLYRKYPSTLESILKEDHVDKSLLEILYKNVQKNIGMFKKYLKAKKQFFLKKFNKKMEPWDASMDLVNIKNVYTIEEAQKILLDVTSIMPYEYPEIVKKAIDERWIDYVNVPSKRSGAYSIGDSYGIDKIFILMNFDGTLDSVNTLCHEMGHSLHSYYSNKNQPIFRSQYPIFLAEIASIFNELLLNDYLFNNAKSDEEKFALLSASISDFMGTVIRQTQWSNYEYDLYNEIDKGEPLNTYEALENLYVNNAKKYAFDSKQIKINKKENIYSTIVPHFYYHFYVYKYAIGYIVANTFFQKYKIEGIDALKKYIDKFLSAGDKDWPTLILKEAGVDIYSNEIYEKAFSIINEKISKYIKLGRKIFYEKY
ncbi:oligoendopeptidase F [Metamycoplasma buccale]|uniref:oligoendopeptidase F n=1 Tax=Metamycoplasma buccale TaxID=55602 RepID=UPI00398F7490